MNTKVTPVSFQDVNVGDVVYFITRQGSGPALSCKGTVTGKTAKAATIEGLGDDTKVYYVTAKLWARRMVRRQG